VSPPVHLRVCRTSDAGVAVDVTVDELSGNRQTPVMQGLAMLKTAVWIPVCRFAPVVTGVVLCGERYG